MNQLPIIDLHMSGLKLIEPQNYSDSRGCMSRLFCSEALSDFGWNDSIAQINHTLTSAMGTVRGMHYQINPYAEMKLVRCIRGKIWDVVVDIRAGSPTFLQWSANYLSKENGRAILIPRGFAHGFQSMTNDVELIYCHSEKYVPDFESGLNPRDPRLSIPWPLPITNISLRDDNLPLIQDEFRGVVL